MAKKVEILGENGNGPMTFDQQYMYAPGQLIKIRVYNIYEDIKDKVIKHFLFD